MSTESIQVSQLFRRADQLARGGDPAGAAQLFEQILAIEPSHLAALTFLSMWELEGKRYERSAELMRRAVEAEPNNAVLQQNLGVILAEDGELIDALMVLRRATELNDQYASAWLHIGGVLEDLHRFDEAIDAYTKAIHLDRRLETADQDDGSPERIKRLARKAAALKDRTLHAMQDAAFDIVQNKYGADATKRLAGFLRMHQGLESVEFAEPLQRPVYQYFPDLPARPWFERDEFEWVSELEGAFPFIQQELRGVLEHDEGLIPYVSGTDQPPPQWNALTDSLSWGAFHLLQGGERHEENCARCPRTIAVLERLPLVHAQGHAPEAFFSILRPGVEIPPHFGLANTKLAVHLALVVPDHCGIRVGDETRSWHEGQCLIFDDSFGHEAWNRSGQVRAVLITEVWNPYLTPAEREGISAIAKSSDDFSRRWTEAAS